MTLTVLTFAYNEEFLMPFLLRHYFFADRIHVIVDADTSDSTREIVRAAGNTTMEEFKFPDMMDDDIKAEKFNLAAYALGPETDWLMLVDADEFIFSATGEDVRGFLCRQEGNVVASRMWQVYRHADDSDLRIDGVSPVYQRRHGDPNREIGNNSLYCKPIVLRMPMYFKMGIGNHSIQGSGMTCGESLDGAHWAMADPCFAVKRRVVDRKLRQSKVNLEKQLTSQHHHVTEEMVLAECAAHLNDPQLF